MGFKDLSLKKTYSSDEDNVLFDFYIPVLKQAVKYDRLAGFFSSSALAIAARGLIDFINNGGTMRLVASPRLSKDDVKVVQDAISDPEGFLTDKLLECIFDTDDIGIADHLKLLGWMIANKKLDIKIAVVYDYKGNLLSAEEIEETGLFHQKIGILCDRNKDRISFSGSINESAAAWLDNVEEFKVFRGWNELELEYLQPDVKKFARIWNGQSARLKIFDIPQAVKDKFIGNAPKDLGEINWEKYHNRGMDKKKVKLFEYQQDAIGEWLENGKRLLFEMATGTGKTFTALGCYDQLQRYCDKLVTIITAPKNHLVQQWKTEVNKFGIEVDYLVADGTNRSWKKQLFERLVDISLGYQKQLFIFTTHTTFSSKAFRNIVEEFLQRIDTLLIADEVHGVGAEKSRLGLDIDYKFRIGLSATPERWFDIEGTNKIIEYFGNHSFEFPLEKAIYEINPATGQTFLTPYRYHLSFIELNQGELYDYLELTKKIVRNKSYENNKDIVENLIFKRADVIKDAENKNEAFERILDEINDKISWTIVYCSPNQINWVIDILNKRGISCHRFTMKEGIIPLAEFNGLSERGHILNLFAEGKYKVLVAMRCLDEGVDVPPARNAIFLSSSGNPREHIQRIGRVIRRYANKSQANIYDILVKPSLMRLPDPLKKIEKLIFLNQLDRCKEIAEIALNNYEALTAINNILKGFREEIL